MFCCLVLPFALLFVLQLWHRMLLQLYRLMLSLDLVAALVTEVTGVAAFLA